MQTIMVVEDQSLIRDAISTLLSLEDDFDVIHQCEDGEQALNLLTQSSALPDIVLSDIEMPNVTGIELAEQVSELFPDIKFVIMTTFAKAGYVRRAMSSGAKGFILKDVPSDYLVSSLRDICKGKVIIDPELAVLALGDKDPLSEKERKAIQLIGDGLSTQQVADKLFLSQGTVRNYLSEAISKLNAMNSNDAARIARQKGWL
ncbi:MULTISPECIES: response regulator transcription factor [Alteromonadaceae]|jgi:two-component system response regulator DesR|uniref:Response regulator transcription factor n=1 Tax=Brumicola blandensis TaxID=3075611 RepID=A0AAW8R313_9ALTE|nr:MULTISPECIES: response regulator transcription factor [unclassified Alteromonas]MDT0583577.1 response regulator transcription factor [Alteromonas sp. W409]MDT0629974.1 response regulator transcription factor [Alteromonas sp. W364]